MTSRILCTGASGFIGKHMMKAMPNCVPYDLGKTFVKGPFDGIIHLAAIARVKTAEKDPLATLSSNLMLTAELIEEFKPNWFMLASTLEPPRNVYGLSKRFAEDYVKLRCHKYIILRLANVYGPDMQQDKLLPAIKRNEADPAPHLPFEHIHVNDVIDQVKVLVGAIQMPGFRSFTMKLSNGIAKTEDELRHVAASY